MAAKAIDGGNAAIRFHGTPRAQVMQGLQAAWRGVAPNNPFIAKTADERLAEFYRPDQQRATLFSAGASLAVGIACVGLYGLASFNTARRTREIGIRKTLGASTGDVPAAAGRSVHPASPAGQLDRVARGMGDHEGLAVRLQLADCTVARHFHRGDHGRAGHLGSDHSRAGHPCRARRTRQGVAL